MLNSNENYIIAILAIKYKFIINKSNNFKSSNFHNENPVLKINQSNHEEINQSNHEEINVSDFEYLEDNEINTIFNEDNENIPWQWMRDFLENNTNNRINNTIDNRIDDIIDNTIYNIRSNDFIINEERLERWNFPWRWLRELVENNTNNNTINNTINNERSDAIASAISMGAI